LTYRDAPFPLLLRKVESMAILKLNDPSPESSPSRHAGLVSSKDVCHVSKAAHIRWSHLVRSLENDDMFLGSKPTMSRPSRAISGGTVTTSRRPMANLSGSTLLPK